MRFDLVRDGRTPTWSIVEGRADLSWCSPHFAARAHLPGRLGFFFWRCVRAWVRTQAGPCHVDGSLQRWPSSSCNMLRDGDS